MFHRCTGRKAAWSGVKKLSLEGGVADLAALLLALSISMDSFGIGISYGIKKIKLTKVSLLIIFLMSIGSLLVTWLTGQFIVSVISIYTAKIVCSLLLIILGIFIFTHALFDYFYPMQEEERLVKKLRIKSLQIIVNIIREPSSSDMDHSGFIDVKEALYIGAALSIDTLSVGLAGVIYGLNLMPFALYTVIMNITFLKTGEFIGKHTAKQILEDKLKFLSGTIIIVMGILKLL